MLLAEVEPSSFTDGLALTLDYLMVTSSFLMLSLDSAPAFAFKLQEVTGLLNGTSTSESKSLSTASNT